MNVLLYKLSALQIYTKDCHYAFTGVDFRPLHEWMDEISDPLAEWIDEIKESIMLKDSFPVPLGTTINAEAAAFVPSIQGTPQRLLEQLKTLLLMNIFALNALNKTTEDVGTGDLLGRIGAHLQKHVGLLNLALNEIRGENEQDKKDVE